MKRGNTIGVRLRTEDQSDFQKIVDEEGTNQSSKIAKIVHDWLHFMKSKQERGDITLAGEIIKNCFNAIPNEELCSIAKKNAKYVIKEMRWQEEDLDFDEVSKRIVEWNMENERQLIRRERNNRISFKQRHDLGIGWSVHQCEMYAEMFRLIGETVESNSIKHDKGSFGFEVIQHSKSEI